MSKRLTDEELSSLDAHTPSEWHGPMWNGCGTCNWTRRSDSRGYGLRWCLWCERDAKERLRTLSHNLAIAGGLCASFGMGRDAGPGAHVPFVTAWWRPGCGKPWTWPLITRDDPPAAAECAEKERR